MVIVGDLCSTLTTLLPSNVSSLIRGTSLSLLPSDGRSTNKSPVFWLILALETNSICYNDVFDLLHIYSLSFIACNIHSYLRLYWSTFSFRNTFFGSSIPSLYLFFASRCTLSFFSWFLTCSCFLSDLTSLIN